MPVEFDPGEFQGPDARAKRLYYALLMDAIGYLLRVRGKRAERETLAEESRLWVETVDVPGEEPWMFSFDQTCQVLGLPAARLRTLLLSPTCAVHFVVDRALRVRRCTPPPLDRIREAVAQGVSFARVAAKYRVPIALIRKEASALRKRRIQERNAAIRARYQLQQSFESIARQFALSPVQIGRICKY